ncbi:MAG TPA: hypothetical protein PL048_05375 [Leptospiraceae bacterium]|nr:hypothetical protein [Leptospiraceae bacterium]HMZ58181.1 hypothetical protein [Leptospiraceae bacterium]HNF14882.1 hypothetical protein [Leptospiraceae bacterium]HNF27323.1 hypothetical protein [Leptospiraceae bacterium]HNI26541.1 hypothetical protein [Leptospiraceae bacterium]
MDPADPSIDSMNLAKYTLTIIPFFLFHCEINKVNDIQKTKEACSRHLTYALTAAKTLKQVTGVNSGGVTYETVTVPDYDTRNYYFLQYLACRKKLDKMEKNPSSPI